MTPTWSEQVEKYIQMWGGVGGGKKGRETQAANQNFALDTAKQQGADQQQAVKSGNSVASTLTSAPGQLSSAAQANYGAAQRNNAQQGNQERQQGFAQIARRGFGSVPVGAGSSVANTANRDVMGANTGAYTNAQNQTQAGNMAAMGYYGGQQSALNPTGAINAGSNAAQVRSQMGSTLGDVMGGIGALGSLASIPMGGGGGFMGLMKK